MVFVRAVPHVSLAAHRVFFRYTHVVVPSHLWRPSQPPSSLSTPRACGGKGLRKGGALETRYMRGVAASSAMSPAPPTFRLVLFFCVVLCAALCVSASGSRAKNDFGLEIAEHASGCLIVQASSGKAAACGLRKLDLICEPDLTVDSIQDLKDSTRCDIFTVRHHSHPCLAIPVSSATADNAKFDAGLRLKMEKLKRRPNEPSELANHFIVESVTADSVASNYPISPGDSIRSINGILLIRKGLDEVKHLLKGHNGRGILELCTWSNPIQLSNSPHENDWSVKGILAASFVGIIIIVLLFRKPQHKTTPPPPPPPPYPLPPIVEEVVRDLNNPDPSKQAKAEAELKKIFDDESRSEKHKSDVRSAVIHAGMLTKWAEELEEPFLRNRMCSAATLQDFGDRWKDRLIHLCNMIQRQKIENILATTPQERKNHLATTDRTFELLLRNAVSDFWNGMKDSSELDNLLEARLMIIRALVVQTLTNYTLQRKAEQGGIFDILFDIQQKHSDLRISSFGFKKVSEVVWQCFEILIRTNFRLQKKFLRECLARSIKWPSTRRDGLFSVRRIDPNPDFSHIALLDEHYSALCRRSDPGLEVDSHQSRESVDADTVATVSLRGNRQIDGTCYAYASARSFIHW
jgi:hypothetical protein